MLWIKKGTHVIDHVRFLEAGAMARDLYEWGMLYSGKHETDGELPMTAVLTSAWGYGGQRNVKLSETLCRVGLWERTDRGFRILRWSEQGNQTKAQITADRVAARERKARRGSGKVRANDGRTNVEVPTSTSTSLSGSESGSGSESKPEATAMPEWFTAAADAASMAVGPIDERPARWLEYVASRSRKTWAMNHADAVGWLVVVIRSEKSRAKPRAGGNHIVQLGDNRAWKLPEGFE